MADQVAIQGVALETASFPDWDGWFAREYTERLGGRYATTHAALNVLWNRYWHVARNGGECGGPTIVETGCARLEGDWSAGMSTFILAHFCSVMGGRLFSVDHSRRNVRVARDLVAKFNSTTFVVGDSLRVLPRLLRRLHRCDLLFLDSMDCPPDGDARPAQLHQLSEWRAAEPFLAEGTVLLLDDNAYSNGGKTLLTKTELREHEDWLHLLDADQSLWLKLPAK